MGEVSRSVRRYLSDILSEEDLSNYLEFINQDPAQYIRVNLLKTTPAVLKEKLKSGYNILTEELPGIPNALKVIYSEGQTGKTVEHILGDYYIQGLSSMLPPIVLAPSQTDKVLDLAAAPGSKTTGLGEFMQNRGMLIANEIALDRVKMLVYNLDRMNIINSGVLHFKGELLSKVYSNYFDKVLVDAPCSGLGIIQKKGEINDWWSKEKAEGLGEIQTKLLVGAIKMLKPGGELVYSTCTLTVEENELVLDRLLRKYPVELIPFTLPVKSHDAFTFYERNQLHPSIALAKRIIPWEVNSDGFFIAKLRKTDETISPGKMEFRDSNQRLLKHSSKELSRLLPILADEFGVNTDLWKNYQYLLKGSDIFFTSGEWEDDNLGIFERIGTKLGVIDKRNEITLHTQGAQVLQKHISKRIIDLQDSNELKKYLEGGIIKKESNLKGQCVVQYQGSIPGTAVITDAGIKSRFPRSKRTQEIVY